MELEIKGHVQPIYSCLSITWSIIADIDIKSEFMRKIGVLRLDLYAAWCVLTKRRYKGRLSFTSEENENLQTLNESITSPNWTVVEDDFTIFLLSNQPYILENMYSNPLIALDDGFLDLQYMHNVSYFQQAKYLY